MMITNGNANSQAPLRFGGGIVVFGDATLHGTALHVSNNIATTGATTGFGGGIALNNGRAYITNTLVYSNAASLRSVGLSGSGVGGGLYAAAPTSNAGYLSLASSTIQNNIANNRSLEPWAAGGGLYVGEGMTATLTGNEWRNNVARGLNSLCVSCNANNVSADGGAIAVSVSTGTANLTIYGDSFIGNTADISNENFAPNEKAAGGAISLLASNTAGQITANIYDSYFSGNTAKAGSGTGQGRGGAIHGRNAFVNVQRSLIVNNQAALAGDGYGGGIYVREPYGDSALNLVNTILANNLARGLGDGAQVYINYTGGDAARTVDITHVTIANNGLNPKQGIFYFSDDASHEFTMVNTIIAHHAIGIRNVNPTGMATANYMLFHGNTENQGGGSTAFPNQDGWVVGDPDPLFVDVPALEFHLQMGSPAINAGIDAAVTNDYDSDPRPVNGGFDIGADEYTTPELAVSIEETPIAQMDTVSFGTTPIGTAVTRTFTIENIGSGNLVLSSLAVTGTGFSLAEDFGASVLAPSEETTFAVALDATLIGNYTATVSFANNDSNQNPFTFTVAGTVVITGAPELVLSSEGTLISHMDTVDVGGVPVGHPLTRTFTVSNTGDANLILSGLLITGTGFTVSEGFGTNTVPPNGSTTFAIELDTSMVASYTATVLFAHNDLDVPTPFMFNVTGEVVYATYLPLITK